MMIALRRLQLMYPWLGNQFTGVAPASAPPCNGRCGVRRISTVLGVISSGAQSPDHALGVEQQIKRVADTGDEYAGAHHRLDGTTLAHVNCDRQASGIPDRRQP